MQSSQLYTLQTERWINEDEITGVEGLGVLVESDMDQLQHGMYQINARGGIRMEKPRNNQSIWASDAWCNQKWVSEAGGGAGGWGWALKEKSISWDDLRGKIFFSFCWLSPVTHRLKWTNTCVLSQIARCIKSFLCVESVSVFPVHECLSVYLCYKVNKSLDWMVLCSAQSTWVLIGRKRRKPLEIGALVWGYV